MFNAMEFLTDITFFGLAFFISFALYIVLKKNIFKIIYSVFQIIIAFIAIINVLFTFNSIFILKTVKKFDYFIIMYSAFILFLCVLSSAYVLIKFFFDDYEDNVSVNSFLKETKKSFKR